MTACAFVALTSAAERCPLLTFTPPPEVLLPRRLPSALSNSLPNEKNPADSRLRCAKGSPGHRRAKARSCCCPTSLSYQQLSRVPLPGKQQQGAGGGTEPSSEAARASGLLQPPPNRTGHGALLPAGPGQQPRQLPRGAACLPGEPPPRVPGRGWKLPPKQSRPRLASSAEQPLPARSWDGGGGPEWLPQSPNQSIPSNWHRRARHQPIRLPQRAKRGFPRTQPREGPAASHPL